MSRLSESLPFIRKIALLLIIGAVLFACGLCLGAAATAILTRPGPPGLSSGPAGSALDRPARPGTPVVAGDLEIQVTGAVRPADDIVAEGGILNPRPGPGNEMIWSPSLLPAIQRR